MPSIANLTLGHTAHGLGIPLSPIWDFSAVEDLDLKDLEFWAFTQSVKVSDLRNLRHFSASQWRVPRHRVKKDCQLLASLLDQLGWLRTMEVVSASPHSMLEAFKTPKLLLETLTLVHPHAVRASFVFKDVEKIRSSCPKLRSICVPLQISSNSPPLWINETARPSTSPSS